MEAIEYKGEWEHSSGNAAVLHAAGNGNADALDIVMVQYRERVLKRCRFRGLTVDEAEDVMQTVFLKAYRAMGRYEHQNQFAGWLNRITDNACIDHLRKRVRQRALGSPIGQDEDGAEQEFAGSIPDPEAAYEAGELREMIGDALDELSDALREALVLKEVEGLSYQEIAERIGCGIGTVKSRIFRARQQMLVMLKPQL